jgi:hypothetical protein
MPASAHLQVRRTPEEGGNSSFGKDHVSLRSVYPSSPQLQATGPLRVIQTWLAIAALHSRSAALEFILMLLKNSNGF